MTLEYAMLFMTDDDGNINVSFPDLPWCNTWGRNEDEAKINAAAAYHAYVEAMYDQGTPMPKPQEYELRKNKKAATDGDDLIKESITCTNLNGYLPRKR